jgi:dTDP-4-dehydrorhamnose 3,5-epimerase
METYKKDDYVAAGITREFVQDNESSSTKGVLRGLHFQKEHTQGKLVRVTHGEVFDVAVDVRPDSETYGQWVGVILSSEKKNMLFVPEGFAHGFLVLSDTAEFVYKCTDVYDPSAEGGIPWNDPDINVEWPKLDVPYKTSEKDEKHESFRNQSFEWAKKWI